MVANLKCLQCVHDVIHKNNVKQLLIQQLSSCQGQIINLYITEEKEIITRQSEILSN